MAKVPNGVETLPKISIAWVGCTNVTDRQTDGLTTTYSEREHEFTFAKNSIVGISVTKILILITPAISEGLLILDDKSK